ncbi:hypothetical protein EB796_021126 [Bugula neritina]|uniref:Uncharacterized protein n=1 Tax=Bugula neritina TaxID=10212 RepID=A0A7J7J553_BUGNE|nr:hypothetical protein EB796_021126 [Bugula neritina]
MTHIINQVSGFTKRLVQAVGKLCNHGVVFYELFIGILWLNNLQLFTSNRGRYFVRTKTRQFRLADVYGGCSSYP